MPKVSVIIPCFNGAHTLGRAIESVLAQTIRNLELIVVDDGSSDDSPQVVQRYAADSRLTILRNDANLGIAATKNRAIRGAVGEYVAFLDQDDVWTKDKLEQQIPLFADPAVGFAYCSVIWRDESDRELGRFRPPLPKTETHDRLFAITATNAKILLSFPIPSASTIIVRRSFFDRHGLLNEKLYSGDEIELCSRVLNQYTVMYDDEALVYKTRHSGCASHNTARMHEARLMLLDEIIRHQPSLGRYANTKRAELYYQNALDGLRMGRRSEARSDLLQSIKRRKCHIRYYAALALTFDRFGIGVRAARKTKAVLRRLAPWVS